MSATEKMARERVQGFLTAKDGRMVNERGEEILLFGMGLGNWFLPEGYMWLFSSCDRPRRIEKLVCDLCGEDYAASFWHLFRERYVTEEDVRRMAELGFNSVRLPLHWRVLMEEPVEKGDCVRWKEDGFALIDRFLDWCEKYKLYVCLDLHGAPGGQTGHNIDDSTDDIPHLLTDGTDSVWYHMTLALWREIARRYRDRWIVGMYDLLNEPYRTAKEGTPELPDLTENLRQFYRDCIHAIREIDGRHMVSVESHYWASQANFFTEKFDENMCAHFHRYWCPPTYYAYLEFLERRKALNMTLYLGETGENSTEWYAAMYPLAAELDIGCNVWPWKKMATTNSPYSVRPPKGWDKIRRYAENPSAEKPSVEEARAIFDEYLDNILLANCDYISNVVPSIFRRPGSVLRAVDFDTLTEEYRGVTVVDRDGNPTGSWDKAMVRFAAGAKVTYPLYSAGEVGVVRLVVKPDSVDEADSSETTIALSVDGVRTATVSINGNGEGTIGVPVSSGKDTRLSVECLRGSFTVEKLLYAKK